MRTPQVSKVSWCEVHVFTTAHATDTITQLCSRFPGYGVSSSGELLALPTDRIPLAASLSALCTIQRILSFPMLRFKISLLGGGGRRAHRAGGHKTDVINFNFHDNQVSDGEGKLREGKGQA